MSRLTRTMMAAACVLLGSVATAVAQPPPSAPLVGPARDAACAPAAARVAPPPALTIAAGREERRTLFGIGDAVVVRGGSAQGVKPGDEYYVRRLVVDRFAELEPGVHPVTAGTAGALRILETETDFSIAVVTTGCDGVVTGDFLERFEPPAIPELQQGGTPDYTEPGRLIVGAERRQMAAAGQFMILDRGNAHGVRAGQQLTVFRRTAGGGPVAVVGTAMVFTSEPERSVVRIERSVDAVYVGDLVAIHR